jgi:hypothetical protein
LQEQVNKMKEAKKKIRENHEKELEELRNHNKDIMNQKKEPRRASLRSTDDLRFFQDQHAAELAVLKAEIKKLETQIITQRINFLKEKDTMNQDWNHVQEMAIEAKLQLAQLTMDVETYKYRFSQCVKECKAKNIKLNAIENPML